MLIPIEYKKHIPYPYGFREWKMKEFIDWLTYKFAVFTLH